jgi:hypothetical protein
MIKITSTRSEDCGKMPEIDNKDCDFLSYFENSCGEQAVIYLEKGKDVGVLLLGDAGWHNKILVDFSKAPDVVLNAEELAWYKVCLATMFKIVEMRESNKDNENESAEEMVGDRIHVLDENYPIPDCKSCGKTLTPVRLTKSTEQKLAKMVGDIKQHYIFLWEEEDGALVVGMCSQCIPSLREETE